MSTTSPTENTPDVPQDHIDFITAQLTEKGPMDSSGIIHCLIYEEGSTIPQSVISTLCCPGTWRIDVGDEHSLIGLDSQAKPGDGSVQAAADYMGLDWLETDEDGAGAWIPRYYTNRAAPAASKAFDLEYFVEHGHIKYEEVQAFHTMTMRKHGITDGDEVIADWNRRDPEAPWGSGIIGKYVMHLTGLVEAFMKDKIEEARKSR